MLDLFEESAGTAS